MSTLPEPPEYPWPQPLRDYWFYGLLVASLVSVLVLLAPYAYALLFAAVIVVVSWPVYQRVLLRCRRRTWLAAILTTVFLAGAVGVPLGLLAYLFAIELIDVIRVSVAWIQGGQLATTAQAQLSRLPGWLRAPLDAPEMDLLPRVQAAAVQLLNALGGVVPGILNGVASASIEAVIFVLAMVTLYMEGPRVIWTLKNLLPINDTYKERLFTVFVDISRNLVVGSLGTAAVQGVVAGVGYWIAGMEGVLFYAILTAVGSFVPLVGTAFVWLPLSLIHAATAGLGWGAFVAIWSLAFTGTVDNLVKPLFLRGGSNIHPLLIFLSVFGGLAWMGLPGVLVGPLIFAMFLTLYTIYIEDFLGYSMVRRLAAEPPFSTEESPPSSPSPDQALSAVPAQVLPDMGVDERQDGNDLQAPHPHGGEQ